MPENTGEMQGVSAPEKRDDIARQQNMPADPLMQFFKYDHLRPALQNISRPFGELAAHIVTTLPRNPERTVALRKLLEAKDCAVRAVLYE